MTVPTFCGKDCGGGACPLLAEVEGGRVLRVRPNPAAGPYLAACRRGLDLPALHYAPERLRVPLVRTGERGSGCFREASWDEALDLVATRLAAIRAAHGASSILSLSSAGSTGALHSSSTLAARYLDATGGATFLSGSYSNGAARFVLPYLLGPEWKASGFDAATLLDSRLVLLWGANVLEARLGAELPAVLLEARRRGTRIVVLDPRRTSTAARLADEWIPVLPGSDAALMLAVLHVLFSEGLARRDWAAARSTGLGALEDYVLGRRGGGSGSVDADALPRSPEWAEPLTGVPAETIRSLARTWAAARPAALLPGYSVQRVLGGEEPYRLAVALQLVTGNFGVRGGSTGSLNNRLPPPRVGSLGRLGGPVTPTVPVLRWAEAILGGRAAGFPSDIRAAYCVGSNYLNQGPDLGRNALAFSRLDFAVAHEHFLTPTARHCDVVLPAASPLEKEDIGIPWAGNYLLYKPRATEREGQARDDFEILAELAERAGAEAGLAFTGGKDAARWIEEFIRDSEIEDPAAFRASGLWFGSDRARVGLADFAADPVARPLGTPSGRVELASAAWARDTGAPEIPTWRGRPRDPRLPLLLVTPKSPERTHSQGRALRAREAREAGRDPAEPLELCRADAEARGIADGDPVRVRSALGSVARRARIVDGLMAGVVSMLEGAWDGESPNLLIAAEPTGPAGACVMHGVPVEVESAVPIP